MTLSHRLIIVALGLTTPFAVAGDLNKEVRATLEKATAYMRSIATEGGYVWRYSLDLKMRAGEVKTTDTQIWIQPPGTPTMGMTFLRLYDVTEDTRYLDAAKAAADALGKGQMESGGWDYGINFDPEKSQLCYLRSDVGKLTPEQIAERKNLTNYDDSNTQSAIQFLLAVADASKGSNEPIDVRIREALDYGLKKMLEAQYPNGAWPQRWLGQRHNVAEFPVLKARFPESYPHEFPKANYYALYTQNDDMLHECISTMLDAFHRTGKAEYLAAAKKGGDFFILAQMPEPQPAWAQQYNLKMEPAWARAFEPPAVTADESVGVIRTLMKLYEETGEDKYLAPIPAALAWYKRSELSPGVWARYYEMQTNKQLFGDWDGKIYYRLEDISENRQHHYRWSGSFGAPKVFEEYENLKSLGREAYVAQQKPKPLSKAKKAERVKELEPEVKAIIAALDNQGRWVVKGHIKYRNWEFDDRVETAVFIKNVETLADYLEAAE